MKPLTVAVIGGGAAGFFAAISCKAHHPDSNVTLYERTGKVLEKVKVSGGGRCNVTHACFQNSQLSKFYPRGEKWLKKAFVQFSVNDTIAWFESRGVKLKTEEDGRMFPVTNRSQTIIDCLVNEAQKQGVDLMLHSPIIALEKNGDGFNLKLKDGQNLKADKVIIAWGGSPKLSGFEWLQNLGHEIVPPVPSLFTFNMPKEKITSLMGVTVNPVSVCIQGIKLKSSGPLLITHWGMSGPAVLKLSAFGARILNEMNYGFNIRINWLDEMNEEEAREKIVSEMPSIGKSKISNKNPFQLPNRLWIFLLEKIEINPDMQWNSLVGKNLNRMLNILLNDVYQAEGKTTFKEEFVTCGGVSLNEVSPQTMESKICPGLYFAGEVLDVDGVTGGFNFQAAWTTGFIAGKLSSSEVMQ